MPFVFFFWASCEFECDLLKAEIVAYSDQLAHVVILGFSEKHSCFLRARKFGAGPDASQI
jgi:hypothetical protein